MKSRQQRIAERMDKELREIANKRMANIDLKKNRKISIERLTDGITRCSEWESIKRKLLKEPRLEDIRK